MLRQLLFGTNFNHRCMPCYSMYPGNSSKNVVLSRQYRYLNRVLLPTKKTFVSRCILQRFRLYAVDIKIKPYRYASESARIYILVFFSFCVIGSNGIIETDKGTQVIAILLIQQKQRNTRTKRGKL